MASQVALKPAMSPRGAQVGAVARGGGRMVSPTPLVSLTPSTHIQVGYTTGPDSLGIY